jgi:D-sedoheptulose 7-phosphate isomerase
MPSEMSTYAAEVETPRRHETNRRPAVLDHASREALLAQMDESLRVKRRLRDDPKLLEGLFAACALAVDTYRRGGKVLVAGNGGSAGDAQHIAGELVSRFYYDRPALSAIALTTDTSILTAIGNDYGYEQVFARQIEGLGAAGDLFVAISTSGNSPNIVLGIEAAKRKGLSVVGLTGEKGGKMKALCDVCLCVPSSETPRIQEAHILLGHLLCAHIESELFPKTR